MPSVTNAQLNDWRSQLLLARCEHQKELRRQLRALEKHKDQSQAEKFTKRLQQSIAQVQLLKEQQAAIVFPDELPISQRREEISELIRNNQILIVAGETGSGKTTQLPKICLELGYGTRGLIGHTQPRRIAARTVADRIANELNTPLGETVGYQVRFKDQSSKKTQIKLMTDGVLLAEIQGDRMLSRYEVIIIDEAHERSLNIDFLLGLLKPLCKKRKDLKIIITSATIDLNKFAEHFTLNNKPAPIIEVSGRTYPVEVLYQPTQSEDSKTSINLPDVIKQTIEQLISGEAKGLYKANGDILVFCSGEAEIRDIAKSLRRANLPVEVLPLYSRLSVAEQNKVFQRAQQRKVVLATNVAETSITVPGIGYVIDPGFARISRYSFRSKVQRLPIEEISQASANQRMGRCGRVANGVCVRLYSEDNFTSREAFTPAEILRSNLASVILQMRRLGIRDIDHFDFIDRPDPRLLSDGIKLLQELNAVDKQHQLTNIGKQLSVLPVDPRYARILAEAHKHNCLRDALIVVSALSIQDPRERPADLRQKADQKHAILQHGQSDFFSYLYLWQAVHDAKEELSNAQFKKLCQENFWNIARIFEWRELFRQLASACKEHGWKTGAWKRLELPEKPVKQAKHNPVQSRRKTVKNDYGERYINLHKALLTGLLSNIANKDLEGDYLATRNRKTRIYPASSQNKRQPKWIVAAEFLETSRLFLHTVGEIDPAWIIDIAKHLCKYTYSDPKYNGHTGKVLALRKTLLFGLPLREKERVDYSQVNPVEAREIFIMRALVDGLYTAKKVKGKTSFSAHNKKVVSDIKKLETKTRRRNLLVSEQTIYDFYDQRIPAKVVCRSSFEKWYRSVEKSQADLLKLNREQLLQNEINAEEVAQFPDHLAIQGKKIKLAYTFDPSVATDGVSMLIPVALLAPFPENLGTWLVPGLLREKCIALIKTLPKSTRKSFVPASDAIDQVLSSLKPSNISLHEALGEQLFKARGITIDPESWAPHKLDSYYQMNYQIINEDGSRLDEGRDLQALKTRYADAVQKSISSKDSDEKNQFELHNITAWNFGELPEALSYQHEGMKVTAYPMLKIMPDGSLSLLLNYTPELANYYTARALIKLAQLQISKDSKSQSYKYLKKELFKKGQQQSSGRSGRSERNDSGSLANQLKAIAPAMNVKDSTDGTEQGRWKDEVIDAALWESFFAEYHHTPKKFPRNEKQFQDALRNSKQWVSNAMSLETALSAALKLRNDLLSQLKKIKQPSRDTARAIKDIKAQLEALFEVNMLRYTSLAQLKQYPRYLRAVEARLDKLKSANVSEGDQQDLYGMQDNFNYRIGLQLENINTANTSREKLGIDALYCIKPGYYEYAVMLEEWRVSLFAQQLRTPFPISKKRLEKAAHKLLD